jgi:putative transcriptional regulator
MVHKKVPEEASASRRSGADNISSESQETGAKTRNARRDQELTEVDREIIEALTDFRDALRDRIPLETKYTVRQVVVVVPPPQLGPADVRKTREALGVSQPVFADFLGTSASTIRSWEQGQKPPSPMARRFLGFIAADPSYWKSRFSSMVQRRGDEPEASGVTRALSGMAGELPSGVVPRRRGGAVVKKGVKKKAGPKGTT